MVRNGRRVSTHNAITYRLADHSSTIRFGFIVSKAVGNAVVRSRVRRRLKAIAATRLTDLPRGSDFVIRALPGSAAASWSTLNSEINGALDRGKARS